MQINLIKQFLTITFICLATKAMALEAGFSKKIITPQSFDTWEDLNKNGKKDKGEPYNDLNKNGKFDAIYLAGFHQNRPASGVNDDIYAIATVLKEGSKKIAFVTLDTIGFMIDEVEDVRSMIKDRLEIEHVVIHSLHNHETPDTQGLWGEGLTKSGISQPHLKFIKKQITEAVIEANSRLQEANLHWDSINGHDDKFGVVDTRVPNVIERGVRSLIFTSKNNKTVLGSWVHFSNHVETVWSQNTLITADWPGFARTYMETSLGGVSSVFIGNIGGLATTLPDTPVYDVKTEKFITGATFEKTIAQGQTLASVVISSWNDGNFKKSDSNDIFIKKHQFDLRVDNKLFLLANKLGVIRRNMKGFGVKTTKSEVNHIGIGPIEILTIPGELYPEIALGGIENLPGSDFDIEPEEVPPLYELMNGKLNLIFNLANDSVGYIIPFTEWDEKKPYLNNDSDSTYGEQNSVGKYSGKQIYNQSKSLLTN